MVTCPEGETEASLASSSSAPAPARSSKPPEKGNPSNDFVWVISKDAFPDTDPRIQNIASFSEQVLSNQSVGVADNSLHHIHNVESNPNKADAWFDLGLLCGGGRVAGISYNERDCYIKALELDDKHALAWRNLAYCDGGVVKETSYDFQKCLYRARKLGLHNLKDSQALCMKSLQSHSENAVAWKNLGLCGGGEVGGKAYDAKQCYQQALELDIGLSPMVWNHLGESGGGKVKDISYDQHTCYQQALKIDPAFAMAWFRIGADCGGGQVNGIKYDQRACYERAPETQARCCRVLA